MDTGEPETPKAASPGNGEVQSSRKKVSRGEIEGSIWWLLGLVILGTATVTWRVVSYIESGIHQADIRNLTGELDDLKRTLEIETRERRSAEEDSDRWQSEYQKLLREGNQKKSAGPSKLPPTSPPRTYRARAFPAYLTREMIRDFQSAYGTDPTPFLKPVTIADEPEYTQGVLGMHPPQSGEALAELRIPVDAERFRVVAALKGPCSGEDWGSVNVWYQIDDLNPSDMRELKKGDSRTTFTVSLPKDASRLTLFANPLNNGHWCDDLFWLGGRFFKEGG